MAILIPELTIRSAPGGKTSITLEQRIADLEQRLAKLESVVKFQADGSLRIETDKTITIKARTIKFEAQMDVEVRGGSNIEVRAGATLKLRGAKTNVDGAVVTLNGGTRPVARHNDSVALIGAPYAHSGKIAIGSTTILVP